MRTLPVKPTAIWSIAREVKAAAADTRPLLVAGAPALAGKLRRTLIAGGEPGAVRESVGALAAYELEGAELLVYAIEGEGASEADEEALRLAARKGVPIVCVLAGAANEVPDLPYVLATDVVATRAGQPLPVAEVVERVAAGVGDRGYGLAAKLPAIRRAVCEDIVRGFARHNGVLGVAIFIPGADLPTLTLNQIRMVFRIAGAYGAEMNRERAVELLGVVGAGLGFRAVARQALGFVPGLGWALKGAVAYAGTRALGEAAIRYFESGGTSRLVDSVRSRS